MLTVDQKAVRIDMYDKEALAVFTASLVALSEKNKVMRESWMMAKFTI
jgi:hypothetical protein